MANKVFISYPVDYITGHLRYGHQEGEIFLTDEELKEFEQDPVKFIKEYRIDLDLELLVDDWEIDDYDHDITDVEYTVWREENNE